MRLYLELLRLSFAGPRHHVSPAYWASLRSSEQDRLRRAAELAGTEIWVVAL